MKIEQVLDVIDRAAAWAWIRRQYLPGGVVCPGCGALVTGRKALASFERMDRTYCVTCARIFQAKAAVPVLRGSEWRPEDFVKLLLLHLAGQAPAHIAALLGKSASCVRVMLNRVEILGDSPVSAGQSLPGSSGQQG